MAVTWITPTEVTPSSTGWQDADLSSYIAAGATGVILHAVANSATGYNFACRKNGSTDNRVGAMSPNHHIWAFCGVDANRICEINVGSTSGIDVYIVGYFGTDAVFNTNATDKSLSATTTWTDIDLGVDDSATGAIVEVYASSSNVAFGLRKNGSTDNRTANGRSGAVWGIVGVDANEVLEGYIGATTTDFYITGYIKADATFNTNATDLSLGSTGSYSDLSALPSGSTGGIIEVTTSSAYYYALRKNGSSEDIYQRVRYHHWAAVEADASRIIEGEIENTAVDFFLVGYFTSPSSTTYTQGVGGATITPTGSLSRAATFAANVGGATITPTGALSKLISKAMGGATITPIGTLNKQSYKACGGATITPTGNLSESFVSPVSTGGAIITPVGSLSKTIGKMVGKAVITPVGSISKTIGKNVGQAVITPVGQITKSISKTVGEATVNIIGGLTTLFIAGGEPPPEEPRGILRITKWFHSLKDPEDK